MTLVVFPTSRVREALKTPAVIGIDALVLLGIAGFVGALMSMGRQMTAPMKQEVVIDLSYWALPRYTAMSAARGFAAYGLSLVFTLIYGSIAAHNRRAEKVMIPAIDVMQSIPILGFVPVVLLAMINLFPTRELGLELACVVTIFTSQVWNMTFSYHGSVKAIPSNLREAAAMQRLSRWQVFRVLELPASMIGLVWNSMMSMAGGWFFLSVSEAFPVGSSNYSLPGLGSYMAEAINRGNTKAQIAAVIAMIVMIVVLDQFFWRPIVVWSERFKVEEHSGDDKPTSWVVNLFWRSRILWWLALLLRRRHEALSRLASRGKASGEDGQTPDVTPDLVAAKARRGAPAWKRIATWLFVAVLAVGAAAGIWELAKLLVRLPTVSADHYDWMHLLLALGASFARTSAAVALGGLWTLPAGILIGLNPRWSRRLQPVVQVVASYPAPMIFPLIALLMVFLHVPFSIGCVALMLMGTQWYTLFNVIGGAIAIPADLKEAAKVYHLSRWRCWTRLYIPSVFPYLVTGLITSAGGAWNTTIVAESTSLPGGKPIATFGLGSFIQHASSTNSYNAPLLAASVVTMALFVVLVNRVFWKRLYRLAEQRYSLNT